VVKKYPEYGRLAQLDRALVSGTKGRGFNSRIARHLFVSNGISSMKKWIGLLLSLFLMAGMASAFLSPAISKKGTSKETKLEGYRVFLVQDEEKKEQADPHMVQVLKEIQRKLDEWLKSLNERIESEDITRFEVRFLEILRNILEWVKEKVDAKIESSEKEKPIKKQKGMFRETRQEVLPFAKT
jgi:hypothetical protein